MNKKFYIIEVFDCDDPDYFLSPAVHFGIVKEVTEELSSADPDSIPLFRTFKLDNREAFK